MDNIDCSCHDPDFECKDESFHTPIELDKVASERFKMLCCLTSTIDHFNVKFLFHYGGNFKKAFLKFFNDPFDKHVDVSLKISNDILKMKEFNKIDEAINRINIIYENYHLFIEGRTISNENLNKFFQVSPIQDYDIELINKLKKWLQN